MNHLIRLLVVSLVIFAFTGLVLMLGNTPHKVLGAVICMVEVYALAKLVRHLNHLCHITNHAI